MSPAPGRPWLWVSCAAAFGGVLIVISLWWEYGLAPIGSLTWSLPFFLAGAVLGWRGVRKGADPPVWWLAGIGASVVGLLYWLLTLLVTLFILASME